MLRYCCFAAQQVSPWHRIEAEARTSYVESPARYTIKPSNHGRDVLKALDNNTEKQGFV